MSIALSGWMLVMHYTRSVSFYTIQEYIPSYTSSRLFIEVRSRILPCAQKSFPIFLSKPRNLVP
jgi:hypothetical protein